MESQTKNSKSSTASRRRAGFTLVEILVAMTLFLIVLGSILTITLQVTRSVEVTESRVSNQQRMRTVSSNLQREVRSADVLHETTAQAFEFSYYHNEILKRVRYEYDATEGQLYRIDKDNGSKETVTRVDGNLLFTYYDRFGTPVVIQNVLNVNVSAVRLQFDHKQSLEGRTEDQIFLSGMLMFRNIS